jgi:biotin carboxyl carrier protein
VRVLLGGACPIVLVDGRVISLARAGSKNLTFAHQGSNHQVELGTSAFAAHARSAPTVSGPVVAPMPGRVLEVRVVPGEAVEVGTPLAVIEAMKMQNEILSPRAGRIARVLISSGSTVERGAVLVEFV